MIRKSTLTGHWIVSNGGDYQGWRYWPDALVDADEKAEPHRQREARLQARIAAARVREQEW